MNAKEHYEQYIQKVPKNKITQFLSFRGRIKRSTFWITIIPTILLLVTLRTVRKLYFPQSATEVDPIFLAVYFLLSIIFFWIICVTSAKRLHDFGLPGWLSLIVFIPRTLFPSILILGIIRGKADANKYGEAPQGSEKKRPEPSNDKKFNVPLYACVFCGLAAIGLIASKHIPGNVVSNVAGKIGTSTTQTTTKRNTSKTFAANCAGSPKEALLELPAPAREWIKVGCTPFGHILMAQNGWSWLKTPIPQPVFLPSDLLNTKIPRKIGNKSYFKEFKLRKLPKPDALKRHELFYVMFEKERVSISPEVWELIATNESNKSLILNIFRDFDRGGWGIACIPKCGEMMPFVMIKAKKKRPINLVQNH